MKKLASILFLSLFLAGTAFAQVSWTFTGTPDAPDIHNWHISGSAKKLYIVDPADGGNNTFGTVPGVASGGHLSKVDFTVFKYYSGTCSFSVTAYDASNTALETSSTGSYTKSADGWGVETSGQVVTVNFANTTTLANVSSFLFNDVTNSCISDNQFNLLAINTGVTSIWSHYSYSDSTAYDPVMVVTSDLPDATVQWQNPPFGVNSDATPDFKLWKVCINIPVEQNVSAFYMVWDYGTLSSPENEDTSYNVQTNGGSPGAYNQCIYFPKTTDLTTPGNMQAIGHLYNTDTDGLLASTNATYFTIIPGEQQDFPTPPNTSPETIACDQGNSIARGFCEVLRYLFVPDTNFYTTYFDDTTALLQEKVPFAYLYALTGSYTSDVPDDGSQTADIGTSYTVGIDTDLANHFSIGMNFFNFSDTATYNAIHPFREVMTALLWVGFGWWLLTRSFKIFKA